VRSHGAISDGRRQAAGLGRVGGPAKQNLSEAEMAGWKQEGHPMNRETMARVPGAADNVG